VAIRAISTSTSQFRNMPSLFVGNNVIYELPVNFAQAALGDEVEVPTLEGKGRVKSLRAPRRYCSVAEGKRAYRIWIIRERDDPSR
jgi:hypothetical protein